MVQDRQNTRGRRCWHLVFAALLLFAVSCEKYTRYPPGNWSSLDYSASQRWRVKTCDEVYLARRVTTTDSTVVIEELSKNDERCKVAGRDDTSGPLDHDVGPAVVMPIALTFEEVTSIEKIDHDRVREAVLVVGLTAVAVVAALAFDSWVFSHADWE